MYCPSCGVAIAANLTYCNFCGAKVNSEKTDTLGKTTELRYDSFIMSAMVGLFVLGLIAISVLLGVMKAVLQFEAGQTISFAFLSFFVLVGLEGILISRLFRKKSSRDKSGDYAQSSMHTTKELEAQSRVNMEPVASVTDHTTRTLDPIYNDKR
jgi:predicted lipid-binding transport protein (Tim44 family)